MAVGWLLFETVLEGTTKIRCGIAFGPAYIDHENSIFVGAPIVEAHLLEQDQQWAGAALTATASARVPEYARTGNYADWWVTPWDVPLKNGKTMKTLAVNWNWGVHRIGWSLRWSPESDEPTQEAWQNIPDLCEKFMNTKGFHEEHCLDCKHRKT